MERSFPGVRQSNPSKDDVDILKVEEEVSIIQDATTEAGTKNVSDAESLISLDSGLQKKLVRKIDLRLCTIAGILCSLNLLDSGIISSASVTRLAAPFHIYPRRIVIRLIGT